MSTNDPSPDDQPHQDFEPESFSHLNLYKEPENVPKRSYDKKIGYEVEKKRDRLEFSQEKIEELEIIESDFNRAKYKLKEDFDSKLIFEIHTGKDKYKERMFTEALDEIDVEIISSAEIENGKWVGYTKDIKFDKLKKSIIEYGNDTNYDKKKEYSYNFVDFIKNIRSITPEQKYKKSLLISELDDNLNYYDVEIHKIGSENENRYADVNALKMFIEKQNGKVPDTYVSENIRILRVKTTKSILDNILLQGQVKSVNKVHKPIRDYGVTKAIVELAPQIDIIPPLDDSTSVLVVDSGVVKHPLLEKSLNLVFSSATINSKKIRKNQPYDDVGHGTKMAGIILYGDLQHCKTTTIFTPSCWVNSAKVMFPCDDDNQLTCFDGDELLEHQLDDIVSYIVKNDEKCKIINLSIGDENASIHDVSEQLPIATVIDELSIRYKDLIFVTSTGNNVVPSLSNYPNHLLEDDKDVRIIDPATSAHALTIGAARNFATNSNINNAIYPSSITRVGLGFKNMIKPELIDFGGDIGHDILCLENKFLKDKGWFTTDFGSSTSAALISHYLAQLINKFPHVSRNLIKALLLSSSQIPIEKPAPIPSHVRNSGESVWKTNLKIYGYGNPNITHALSSEQKRVLLKHESTIDIGKVNFYTLYLPDKFYSKQGIKTISVTLVYDPPIDSTKSSYLGLTLDYKLIRKTPLNEVKKFYSDLVVDEKSKTKKKSRTSLPEIELLPGTKIRSQSTHQKSSITRTGIFQLDSNIPLVLAIRCNAKWIDDYDFIQNYSVVVEVEHTGNIDLYNEVRTVNRIRHAVRVRVGKSDDDSN